MIETYIYYKQELVDSSQTIDYPAGNLNQKSALIQNVLAKIYDSKGIPQGYISFTNNTTVITAPENAPIDKVLFTTSIGTINTPHGMLVVNYSFNLVDDSPFLPPNENVSTKPTFQDGQYTKYKNITISVQSFPDGKRLLTIKSCC